MPPKKWVLPVAAVGGVAVLAGLGGLAAWLLLRNKEGGENPPPPPPECDPLTCVAPFECTEAGCVPSSNQNRKPGDITPIPPESGAGKAYALLFSAKQWTDATRTALAETESLVQASSLPLINVMVNNSLASSNISMHQLVYWYYMPAEDLLGLRVVDLTATPQTESDIYVKWLGPDMITLMDSPTDTTAAAMYLLTPSNCAETACGNPLRCVTDASGTEPVCQFNTTNRRASNLSVPIPFNSKGHRLLKLLGSGGFWLDRAENPINLDMNSLLYPGAEVRMVIEGLEPIAIPVTDWLYNPDKEFIIVFGTSPTDGSVVVMPWKWEGETSMTLFEGNLITPMGTYDLAFD